jgi:3-oxosteroid 1-dehydrogenase
VATEEYDLVVVGSGAAGMTAALTAAHNGLRVLVVEKAPTFGGSTARSGGGLWLPGNSVLTAAGVRDTPERAREYLAHVAGPTVPAEKQNAFLRHGPAMLDLVLDRTPVGFAWVPNYADYYPEAPGGLGGGRTIEPKPLDGRILGPLLAELTPPYLPTPPGMAITARRYRWLSLGTRHPRSLTAAASLAAGAAVSRARGRRVLTMGQALAAGLRAGLENLGVPLWLNTSLQEVYVAGGRVAGGRLDRSGEPVLVHATRGVLLAAGGFERDEAMRQKYQRAPIGAQWTVGAVTNTGDAIVAGQALGAAVDLMDDAWWGPSIDDPGRPYFCLAERSLPGCVLVNGAGRRFVNEAAPYVDAVHAMYAGHTDEVPHIPCWLVFDRTYRDRYVFAGRPPRAPLPRRWYAAGVAHRADSVGALAEAIGVPPAHLVSTVDTFNGFAGTGEDLDFGKGESEYDRYYGDPRNRPNPCLGALVKPPYFAVRIVPGDLGTKGGLVTDERARVLREDGTPIEGLYAAGNTSAAVMGHSYAGAGATIGPAMTFGYIAALDIVGG